MEEKNKIIIRIKYHGVNAGLKNRTQLVWNVRKIGTGLVIFIILIFFLPNVLKNDSLKPSGTFSAEYKVVDNNAVKKGIVVKIENEMEKITKIDILKQDVKAIEPVPTLGVNVARALLTTRVDKKEPIDNVTSVVVNKTKASGVYYYTEIIDMNGQTLYHYWIREGKLIYKRKINILGDRWRAATSKLISYSKMGAWAVRLVNMEGDILNEIKFEVVE